MGFRFRLETVLRHRRRIMEDRGREVAVLERKLAAAQRNQAEIEQALDRFASEDTSAPGTRIHVEDLMAKTVWLSRMNERLEESRTRVRDLRKKRDGLRSDLEDAWKNCEVLEKLKSRQAAEYRRTTGRRATVEMDEIGSVRHAFRTTA